MGGCHVIYEKTLRPLSRRKFGIVNSDRRCGVFTTVGREKVNMATILQLLCSSRHERFQRYVACPVSLPVSHLPIDGRPASTPETSPSFAVMVCRLLDDLWFDGFIPVVTGVCLVNFSYGYGFKSRFQWIGGWMRSRIDRWTLSALGFQALKDGDEGSRTAPSVSPTGVRMVKKMKGLGDAWSLFG